MITVHHLKRPAGQRPSPETQEWTNYLNLMMGMKGSAAMVTKEFFKENYESVADVQTDSLNDAWQFTNTIDAPWYKGSRVLTSGKDGYRSSSVGDVFEMVDTTHRFFLVANSGFKEITDILS